MLLVVYRAIIGLLFMGLIKISIDTWSSPTKEYNSFRLRYYYYEAWNFKNINWQPTPKFPPKKDLRGTACEGVYIRHDPFAKLAFFKVDLKCFPMKRFLSRMSIRFSWAAQTRCRKPYLKKRGFLRHIEICQNRSRDGILCFFVRLLVPLILKAF